MQEGRNCQGRENGKLGGGEVAYLGGFEGVQRTVKIMGRKALSTQTEVNI